MPVLLNMGIFYKHPIVDSFQIKVSDKAVIHLLGENL